MSKIKKSPTPTTINAWLIAGVVPAEGRLSLTHDRADDYWAGCQTDLDVQGRGLLAISQNGEVLWVSRPSGVTDLFCKSRLTDHERLHNAALRLAEVAEDREAWFFAGKLGNHGGLIRKISREDAIKCMRRWEFEIAQ